jgi:hypothetical protein
LVAGGGGGVKTTEKQNTLAPLVNSIPLQFHFHTMGSIRQLELSYTLLTAVEDTSPLKEWGGTSQAVVGLLCLTGDGASGYHTVVYSTYKRTIPI